MNLETENIEQPNTPNHVPAGYPVRTWPIPTDLADALNISLMFLRIHLPNDFPRRSSYKLPEKLKLDYDSKTSAFLFQHYFI